MSSHEPQHWPLAHVHLYRRSSASAVAPSQTSAQPNGAHLDVEDAVVAPAVLVVADQRPRLVCRQRRLARAWRVARAPPVSERYLLCTNVDPWPSLHTARRLQRPASRMLGHGGHMLA